MNARKIIIRALSCVESEGYVSKDAALCAGTQSTSQRILSSLEIDDTLSDLELATYGTRADQILNWIMTCPIDGNEYLENCRRAVPLADTAIDKAAGYLSSLVTAFERYEKSSSGLDKITQCNSFAADAGKDYAGTGEVINVQHFKDYAKVSIADSNGFLVTYTANMDQKKLIIPNVGDKLDILGKAYRNKFTTPFETSLSRPTIKVLK